MNTTTTTGGTPDDDHSSSSSSSDLFLSPDPTYPSTSQNNNNKTPLLSSFNHQDQHPHHHHHHHHHQSDQIYSSHSTQNFSSDSVHPNTQSPHPIHHSPFRDTIHDHHHQPNQSQQSFCTQFLINRLIQFEDLGLKSQGLPIRYRDLSVFSSKIDHEIIQTFPRALWSSLTSPLRLLFKLVIFLNPSWPLNHQHRSLHPSTQIPILSQFDGVVQQSELLLVLGRPRSGITSLLRALSLNHQSFSKVQGHLDFGSLSIHRLRQHGLKPLIVMIDEIDQHFASLKLTDTLALAARCRTPRRRPDQIRRKDWVDSEIGNWSKVFGFSSTTLQTLVGSQANPNTTGGRLSGGERKRLSIVEGLLTRSAVLCLDNVTAGLDSANAYHLIQSLKDWCQVDLTSAVIGLRQASDSLYYLFDKVSVLYDGHQIFFGPTLEAVQYFHQLGFLQTPNQPVADFLCSVTDPLTRKVRPDVQHQVPLTPSEFVTAFRRSKHYTRLKHEMLDYDTRYPSSGVAHHILHSVPAEKDKFVGARSCWTVNYFRQLSYLTRRQYALIRSDLRPYMTKTIINLALSFIIGTLFFQLPKTTEAAFSRASVLFLSVLFNGYLQLSELANTLNGREIIQRHGKFGFYSPSALALARTLGDIPLITAQVLMFASITYGLAGLQKDVVRFGIYILLVDATAINLTAVFRMFAAVSASFDEAIRYCGVALNIFVICGGYFIPTPSMAFWVRWIRYYVDPISYAFEAVLSNEFHGLKLQCSPQHIVPRGPSYKNPAYQTCSMAGSRTHSLVVLGDDYLLQSYGFRYSHLWKNLAMIIGSSLVILVLGVIFTEQLCFVKFGSVRLFKNSAFVRRRLRAMKEMLRLESVSMEEGAPAGCETLSERVERTQNMWSTAEEPTDLAHYNSAILTFTNLKLCIDERHQSRTLLDGVDGYFQPGKMTALMGASGAGKTTLLNALAGRAAYGQLTGEILIDGRPLTVDSCRAIGYVEQTDHHDEYSTVREALIFSALLRQPKSTPEWAKLADVDRVIAWLGLRGLEDAIIGTPAAGLGLEDRRKLSIAVELVARPRILCLDEPVSGMDSQSATHIIMLLRKLVLESNLTVIVTVHQPSVEIFESFDRLMLLEQGGKVAYFGPRELATAYFENKISKPCGPIEHPAEFLIHSIINSAPSDQQDPLLQDSNKLGSSASQTAPDVAPDERMGLQWNASAEHTAILDKIEQLNSEAFSLDQTLFDNQRGGVISTEIIELTKRFSRHFWRDHSFSFTQLFTATAVSLMIGLTFFQQASSSSSSVWGWGFRRREITTSLVGLQNQVFSVFLVLFIPPVLMNQLITKWFLFKSIYESREKLAGFYREISLAIGFLLAELPYCLFSASIFWLGWFLCVGFRIDFEIVAFTLGAVQIFFFFQMTWAMWIAALAPTIGIVANLLPFFLVSMEAFNGSLLPYDQMPEYWRWMYWVSPFQWYVKAMLSMVLHDQKVRCQPAEAVRFLAPPSTSCKKYSKEFLRQHGGYILAPGTKDGLEAESESQTKICGYCEYSSGDEFVRAKFKSAYEDSYVCLALLGAYCLANLALLLLILCLKPAGLRRFRFLRKAPLARS